MDVVIVVGIVVHRWMQHAWCFLHIFHDLWIPVYARSLVALFHSTEKMHGRKEKKKNRKQKLYEIPIIIGMYLIRTKKLISHVYLVSGKASVNVGWAIKVFFFFSFFVRATLLFTFFSSFSYSKRKKRTS